MATFQFRPPEPLKVTGSAVGENWTRFKEQWINFEIATGTAGDAKAKRAAAFLTCVGNEAYDVFRSLDLTDDHRKDIDRIIAAFETFCIGSVNVTYERYVFNRRSQEANESFSLFLGELRRLARSCDFGNVEDSLIRDRIVVGLRDDATRRKLLAQRSLTLKDTIDICRASEQAGRQLKAMTDHDEVQATTFTRRDRDRDRYRKPEAVRQPEKSERRDKPSTSRDKSVGRSDCGNCGLQHPRKACPAYGRTCNNCRRRGHFASVCRSKPVNRKEVCQTQEYDSYDDSEGELLTLSTARNQGELLSIGNDADRWYTRMRIDGRTVKFMLDSGATVNLIPTSVINELGRHSEIRPTSTTIRMFDGRQLQSTGAIRLPVRHLLTGMTAQILFHAADKHQQAILGARACRQLNLLQAVDANLCALTLISD
jgi:hypothetical protein